MGDLESRTPINLMIVGAQKAGTTSLLRYLGEHPGICTHSQVEMNYFALDLEYKQGYEQIFPRYFACDLVESSVILAKSISIMLLPEAMSRLHKHNPQVEMLVMLRNPVDRAYSHYWYARRRGWEDKETFEEAIAQDPAAFANDQAANVNRSYLANGLFVNQLGQMMEFFPRDQLHFILLKDLKEDPVTVCRSIFGLFSQLYNAYEPEIARSHNRSAAFRSRSLALLTSSRSTLPRVKKMARSLISDRTMDYLRDLIKNANEREFKAPPMKPETRTRLLAYYQPYNRRLSELIGRDLTHWQS